MSSKEDNKPKKTYGQKLLEDYTNGKYKLTDEEIVDIELTKERIDAIKKSFQKPRKFLIVPTVNMNRNNLSKTVREVVESIISPNTQIVLSINSRYEVTRIGHKNVCCLNKNETSFIKFLSNNKHYVSAKDIVSNDVGYTTQQSAQKVKAKLNKKLTRDLNLNNPVISSLKNDGYTINNLYEIKFVK